MSATTPPPSGAPPGRTFWLGQCDWRELVEDLHLHYASRPRNPGGPAGPRHREKAASWGRPRDDSEPGRRNHE